MQSPENIIWEAWQRAYGTCECTGKEHKHLSGRCNRVMIWGNRGGEGYGAWVVHYLNESAGNVAADCEIICAQCHKLP